MLAPFRELSLSTNRHCCLLVIDLGPRQWSLPDLQSCPAMGKLTIVSVRWGANASNSLSISFKSSLSARSASRLASSSD